MAIIFVMSQGNLDFSIGGIVGIAAALAALSAEVNSMLVFPIALLTGICVGLLNGMIIARFRTPSFITTIGMSFILRGMTSVVLDGSIGLPLSIRNYDNYILKLVVFATLLLGFYILFEKTKYGKHSRAIGSLVEAARQSGVNINRTIIISYIISGLLCGLIAFFSIARTCTASNQTGSGFEFKVLLALLIGGVPLTGGWDVRFRSVLIGSAIMAIYSIA